MSPIEEHWMSFAQEIDLSRESIETMAELRRAFFTGALCIFEELLEAATTLPPDQAQAVLERVDAECQAFSVGEVERGC